MAEAIRPSEDEQPVGTLRTPAQPAAGTPRTPTAETPRSTPAAETPAQPVAETPRSNEEVVEDHLASIFTQDPEAMSADYAAGATLERDRRYVGRDAITGYFRTVPNRLGAGEVVFGQRKRLSDGRISVRWSISGGQADGLSGLDTYTLADGLIVHQVVELDGSDF